MTRADKGRYAAKHAAGTMPDENTTAAVKARTEAGKLACAAAERIGAELGVPMGDVGRTADLLEIRIDRCQLGLFGYDAPGGRIIRPDDVAAPELEKAIRSHLVDGRLPCAAAWEIATALKIPRLKVSSAAELLKIKVKPCQLGAF